MTLKDFIRNFIIRNSMIRLWYENKEDDSYKLVVACKGEDIVSMEWETLKGEGCFKKYVDNEVVGIKDIYMFRSEYVEAINIIIKNK